MEVSLSGKQFVCENVFFIGDRDYTYKIYKIGKTYIGECPDIPDLNAKSESLVDLNETFNLKLLQKTI